MKFPVENMESSTIYCDCDWKIWDSRSRTRLRPCPGGGSFPCECGDEAAAAVVLLQLRAAQAQQRGYAGPAVPTAWIRIIAIIAGVFRRTTPGS